MNKEFYTKKKKQYKRVSNIINEYLGQNEIYAKIPNFILERAAQLGTHMHNIFELIIKGFEEEAKELVETEQQLMMFDDFKRIANFFKLKDNNPKTELTLFDDYYNFAGTIDFVDDIYIIDYKTRNLDKVVNKNSFVREFVQLKLYQHLLSSIEPIETAEKKGLWLFLIDKKGKKSQALSFYNLNEKTRDLIDQIYLGILDQQRNLLELKRNK